LSLVAAVSTCESAAIGQRVLPCPTHLVLFILLFLLITAGQLVGVKGHEGKPGYTPPIPPKVRGSIPLDIRPTSSKSK